MKRRSIALILALALVLTGCAGGMIPNPKTVSGGIPWDGSWTNLGGLLGVEQPGGDFSLLTSNGRLKDIEIHYATWVCGQETETGEDTSVFEGQIYLMVEPCDSTALAEQTLQQWHDQFGSGLKITAREQLTAGEVTCELLHYDCTAADSYFARGIAALWTRENVVLVADIAHADTLSLDLTAAMTDFLAGIHYAD